MDKLVIQGGRRLEGRVEIGGAKNAALPIMAGAILGQGPSRIRNVPDLSDIRQMIGLLGELGVDVRRDEQGHVLLEVVDEAQSHARYDLVRRMRAGVCVLGPLLAKRKYARVSMPGGCAIGPRPIDLHLRGLEALGAKILLENGDIVALSGYRARDLSAELSQGSMAGPSLDLMQQFFHNVSFGYCDLHGPSYG